MAPLKSLSTEFPILDADFQRFCSSHGIFSVEDFLIHDLYILAAYAEQQPHSERLKQGITQVFSIIDGLHQPWTNGMDLLEDVQRNRHALSTGCEGIDSLIKGGLHEGHVTELVGPSSSGKTQLCLQAAATVAMLNGGVLYIDTGNSFSAKRIVQLVGKVELKILQKVMSRLLCKSLYDIFALLSELQQLESNLQSQVDIGDNHVRLLVIDSISSLITPILGGRGPQGRALITSTGSLLKKLAHEYNIAILVTNHTVGGTGGTSKPALGEIWKTIPHVRLLVSRDCGSNSCNISILTHPSVASTKATKFTIHD